MRACRCSHQGNPRGVDLKPLPGAPAAGPRLAVFFASGAVGGMVDDRGNFLPRVAGSFHAGDRVMPQS